MGGPESWEISEKAIIGFHQILSSRNLVGSFGIHPEAAYFHSNLFTELSSEGHELHMQFHAGNFRGLEYRCYLGSYNRDEQLEILRKARDDWMRSIGFPPRTFVPGGGSLNDFTWPVVYSLGFRQAGMPIERNNPKCYSYTVGACPFPHHADPENRLVPGDMELFIVPISINWSRKVKAGHRHLDLRPESGVPLNVHHETVDQNLKIIKLIKPPIKVIVVPTHNTQNYSDLNNPVRKTLEATIDYIIKRAKEEDLTIKPATFESIHKEAHELGVTSEEEKELFEKWKRIRESIVSR